MEEEATDEKLTSKLRTFIPRNGTVFLIWYLTRPRSLSEDLKTMNGRGSGELIFVSRRQTMSTLGVSIFFLILAPKTLPR